MIYIDLYNYMCEMRKMNKKQHVYIHIYMCVRVCLLYGYESKPWYPSIPIIAGLMAVYSPSLTGEFHW